MSEPWDHDTDETTPITRAVHAYYESRGPRDGCEHFDHGYGLYRLCEDPDQDVPIRALPEIFAAAQRMQEAVG